MYHISKDARAKRSAEMICKGLEECLKEKPLCEIRVSNIYERSGVSRATFYRLFDNINDVFAYACDKIRTDVMDAVKKLSFPNKREHVLYCIKRWVAHELLMKALVDNNLYGIFYESHMRNADILKQLYSISTEEECQFECFASILASLTYAALSVYFRRRDTESIEDVYRTICHCTEHISNSFIKI